MGENICKWSNWQAINLKNIQTSHAVQYEENKQPNLKMGVQLNRHFFNLRHADGQQTYEKMLNITNC